MSIVAIPGRFPTVQSSTFVVADDPAFPANTQNQSYRTPGATLIVPLKDAPGISQHWSILSIGFQACLSFAINNTPVYGLLGKLLAGLLIDPTSSGQTDVSGPLTPYQLPPSDASLLTTLWDGSVDPLPPQSSGLPTDPKQLLTVSGSISPPVPKEVYPGRPIGLGLWITPSFLAPAGPIGDAAGLIVMIATYTLVIDNGL